MSLHKTEGCPRRSSRGSPTVPGDLRRGFRVPVATQRIGERCTGISTVETPVGRTRWKHREVDRDRFDPLLGRESGPGRDVWTRVPGGTESRPGKVPGDDGRRTETFSFPLSSCPLPSGVSSLCPMIWSKSRLWERGLGVPGRTSGQRGFRTGCRTDRRTSRLPRRTVPSAETGPRRAVRRPSRGPLVPRPYPPVSDS